MTKPLPAPPTLTDILDAAAPEDRIKPEIEKLVDFSFDLVIANIHYDLTRRRMDTKGFGEKKWVILPGLLRSQAARTTSQLSQPPIKI
jgi:hypothetical protein